MINTKTLIQIDNLIKKINSIPLQQLKTLELHYLQCRRKGKYLFIISSFDGTYMTKLKEFTKYFDKLHYPNKIFRIFALLIIDLEKYKFYAHRFYALPYYLDLYEANTNEFYSSVIKQLEETPMQLTWENKYTISSKVFKVTRPRGMREFLSETYDIEFKSKVTMNWEIDYFIDNYVTIDQVIIINDLYFYRTNVSKEEFLDQIDCSCVKNQEELEHACNECDNASQRNDCTNIHGKKCSCGDWTYYRKNNCLKCHIIYSKANYMQNIFSEDGSVSYDLYKKARTLINYLPFSHHFFNPQGICIGNGVDDINHMLRNELNPIRLMLAFKTNASYSIKTISHHIIRCIIKKSLIRTLIIMVNFTFN